MNENDLLKQVLEEKLINKEETRQRIINNINHGNRGAFYMKKKFSIATICICLITVLSIGAYKVVDASEFNKAQSFLGDIGIETAKLSRRDAKKVYKDIKSDTFEYQTTMEVLKERAVELGIEEIPPNADEIYDAIVEYHAFTSTKKITSSQVLSIKKGTKYSEIINSLGATKDIGSGLHVLQYVVDENKILLISFADENSPCQLSGEELLAKCTVIDNSNNTDFSFNATLTQRMGNRILVNCPTYDKFDIANVGITDKTEIIFEDGSPATLDEITKDMIIHFDGGIRESYPPQITATKIIFKKP